MNVIYVLTGALSIATGIVAGLLGRRGIAQLDHARRERRR